MMMNQHQDSAKHSIVEFNDYKNKYETNQLIASSLDIWNILGTFWDRSCGP